MGRGPREMSWPYRSDLDERSRIRLQRDPLRSSGAGFRAGQHASPAVKRSAIAADKEAVKPRVQEARKGAPDAAIGQRGRVEAV